MAVDSTNSALRTGCHKEHMLAHTMEFVLLLKQIGKGIPVEKAVGEWGIILKYSP